MLGPHLGRIFYYLAYSADKNDIEVTLTVVEMAKL